MSPAATPTTTERRRYQFDEFLVDPIRRILLRHGEPVAVTPKALSILVVLLEKSGEVVDKSDLIQAVWPDSRVSEANLTQNISFLRKALGERASSRRYVMTVPGQGYCFVGDVRTVPPEEPAPSSASLPAAASPEGHSPDLSLPERPASGPIETIFQEIVGEATGAWRIVEAAVAPPGAPRVPAVPTRRRVRAVGISLGLLLVLAAAGAAWIASRRAPPAAVPAPAGAPSRPSVAVLGFRNRSAREAQWLAPALSEILGTELAAGSAVRVISGENVARARQVLALPYSESAAGYDLARVRSFLGADLAIVGAYGSEGTGGDRRIRLDVQVLKLPEGIAVATLKEVGKEADLFDLISRTGTDLRRALGIAQLSPEEARSAEALHPSGPESARLYTQGLARLRFYDPLAARDILAQAAQIDPGSALIHSALAQAWADLGFDARAVAEARKALELASLLSREERLALEARLHEVGRKWGQASEIYRSLWTFFPDDLEYGLHLVDCLWQAGNGKEAMATVAALRKLPAPASDDPRIDLEEAVAARGLTDFATVGRAAAAAVAKGRKSGEKLVLGQALLMQGSVPLFTGRPLDSLAAFREARELFERAGYRLGVAKAMVHIGVAHYRQGEFAAAETAYQEALAISQQIGNVLGISTAYCNIGFLNQNRGDLNRALADLQKSRALFAEFDDPAFKERTLHAISTILLAQGDLAGARRGAEEVLVSSRQVGNRADEARALGNFGTILAVRGSLDEASAYHGKALQILRGVRDPIFTIPVVVDAVDVLARLGDLRGARSLAAEGLVMVRQAGSRTGEARLLTAQAGLALRTGDLAEARAQGNEQLRIGRETGARGLTAHALQTLGRAAFAAGDLRAARRSLLESLAICEGNGEILLAMAIRLDLARLALAEGDPARAAALAREVADWCGPRDIQGEGARALSLLAEALLAEGQLPAARDAAQRALAQEGESEDRELRIEITTRLARIGARGAAPAAVLRELQQRIEEAAKIGLVPAALAARLALAEIQVEQGDGAAAVTAAALRKDAEPLGLGLLARQAAALEARSRARRPASPGRT